MGNVFTADLSPEELELFSMEVDEEYNPLSQHDKVQARLKYRMRQAMSQAVLNYCDENAAAGDDDHEQLEKKDVEGQLTGYSLIHRVPRPTPQGSVKHKTKPNVRYIFEGENDDKSDGNGNQGEVKANNEAQNELQPKLFAAVDDDQEVSERGDKILSIAEMKNEKEELRERILNVASLKSHKANEGVKKEQQEQQIFQMRLISHDQSKVQEHPVPRPISEMGSFNHEIEFEQQNEPSIANSAGSKKSQSARLKYNRQNEEVVIEQIDKSPKIQQKRKSNSLQDIECDKIQAINNQNFADVVRRNIKSCKEVNIPKPSSKQGQIQLSNGNMNNSLSSSDKSQFIPSNHRVFISRRRKSWGENMDQQNAAAKGGGPPSLNQSSSINNDMSISQSNNCKQSSVSRFSSKDGSKSVNFQHLKQQIKEDSKPESAKDNNQFERQPQSEAFLPKHNAPPAQPAQVAIVPRPLEEVKAVAAVANEEVKEEIVRNVGNQEQDKAQLVDLARNLFSAAASNPQNQPDKSQIAAQNGADGSMLQASAAASSQNPAAAVKQPPEPVKPAAEQSLYQKFGGDAKMTLFVDEVMTQFMQDPELSGPHAKIANDPEKFELLKYKMFEYFKFMADGSKRYLGRQIQEVHMHMGISEALFDKSKDKILASMKKMRPRAPVLIEFMKRIEQLRSKICNQPLFDQIQGEQGLQKIVKSMLQYMDENGVRVFKDQYAWDEARRERFTTKYATLLASMIEPSYEWFLDELLENNLIKDYLVMEDDFDGTLEFMQFACIQIKMKDSLTNSLMQILQNKREQLCHKADAIQRDSQNSFVPSPQEQESLERLLNRFFQGVDQLDNPSMAGTSVRQDYVYRITQILHCPPGEELRLDEDKAENMPINSDQPLFLAAGLLYDTMLEMGCPEEDAEVARVAFYALKERKFEESKEQQPASAQAASVPMADANLKSAAIVFHEQIRIGCLSESSCVDSSMASQMMSRDSHLSSNDGEPRSIAPVPPQQNIEEEEIGFKIKPPIKRFSSSNRLLDPIKDSTRGNMQIKSVPKLNVVPNIIVETASNIDDDSPMSSHSSAYHDSSSSRSPSVRADREINREYGSENQSRGNLAAGSNKNIESLPQSDESPALSRRSALSRKSARSRRSSARDRNSARNRSYNANRGNDNDDSVNNSLGLLERKKSMRAPQTHQDQSNSHIDYSSGAEEQNSNACPPDISSSVRHQRNNSQASERMMNLSSKVADDENNQKRNSLYLLTNSSDSDASVEEVEEEMESLDLVKILPSVEKRSTSEQNRSKRLNHIVYQGQLDKVLIPTKRLVQRYIVLNYYALFVYKDHVSFSSQPHKPIMVIPTMQIAKIKQGQILKDSLIKASMKHWPGGDKSQYIASLEISLKRSVNQVQQSIRNFYCRTTPTSVSAKAAQQSLSKTQQLSSEDEKELLFTSHQKALIVKLVRKVSSMIDSKTTLGMRKKKLNLLHTRRLKTIKESRKNKKQQQQQQLNTSSAAVEETKQQLQQSLNFSQRSEKLHPARASSQKKAKKRKTQLQSSQNAKGGAAQQKTKMQ